MSSIAVVIAARQEHNGYCNHGKQVYPDPETAERQSPNKQTRPQALKHKHHPLSLNSLQIIENISKTTL
jgi:hypothetical protein